MDYQPPEVNNLNTPTPTGVNDYLWQHNVVAAESVALVFIAVVGIQGVITFMVVPASDDGDDE